MQGGKRMGAHHPPYAKSLEYRFFTPSVNVMLYGAEYDKLRQRRGTGRKRRPDTIAREEHLAREACEHHHRRPLAPAGDCARRASQQDRRKE
jgi:hypothetical protein